jgi:ubiquinone biosynthesis protein COQ9
MFNQSLKKVTLRCGNLRSFSTLESHVLEKSIEFVPHLGWSKAAVEAAAREMEISASVAGLLKDPVDLAHYFIQSRNAQMKSMLNQDPQFKSLSISRQCHQACWVRLQLLIPVIDKWQDALALMASPVHLPRSLSLLHELINDIWYLAGDKSVDLNWYSKRFILASIYTSTELFMTTDKSPDYQETLQFLDRRFQNSAALGLCMSSIHKRNHFISGSMSAFLKDNAFKK